MGAAASGGWGRVGTGTFPATGHGEVVRPQTTAAEGFEDWLHLSAQVGLDADSPTFEFATERFGDGGAEEHVDGEFGDTAGQRFRGKGVEDDFAAFDLLATLLGDEQQARRRIEDGRDPLVAGGDGDDHGHPETAATGGPPSRGDDRSRGSGSRLVASVAYGWGSELRRP